MRPTRGRPLRFMAMLLVLWVGARVTILWWERPAPETPGVTTPPVVASAKAGENGVRTARADGLAFRADGSSAGPWIPDQVRDDGWGMAALLQVNAAPDREPDQWSLANAATAKPLLSTIDDMPVFANAYPPRIDQRPPSAAPVPPPSPAFVKRTPFSLYGYAYYRAGSGAAALAETRYGGSQAGAIAGYRVAGSTRAPVEAIARLSYSPDDPRSLEPGAGLRWTPVRGLALAAEYRRRADGTGTAIAYVAGGPPPQKLPAGFTLETYGQAGVYAQNGVHPFYDAQATALRPVADLAEVAIAAGAGAWSGGTDDVQRLDIGPRIAVSTSLGAARVTLTADYRIRIAGDAAPGSGPALTLSTGF